MLRDDECARMASAASEPAGREAQQPWPCGQYGCLDLVWCRGWDGMSLTMANMTTGTPQPAPNETVNDEDNGQGAVVI